MLHSWGYTQIPNGSNRRTRANESGDLFDPRGISVTPLFPLRARACGAIMAPRVWHHGRQIASADLLIGGYLDLFGHIDPHKPAKPGEPLSERELLERIANATAELVEFQRAGDSADAYDQPRPEVAIARYTVDSSDGFVIPGDRNRCYLSVYNSGAVELRFFERKLQPWAEGFPLSVGETRDLSSSVATIYLRAQSTAGEAAIFLQRK